MIDIPVLCVEGLNKTFASEKGGAPLNVLHDINFAVLQSEIVCLVGYSGCGKTTLLRIICGFERADSGQVLIDGVKKTVPDQNTIMLFQDFNQLLPWKTLLKNIMFPLLETKTVRNKQEAEKIALKLLKDVGLFEFKDSYPHQVSGGMKQRAAVARALAMLPRVLLMDEPFAALDVITRHDLQAMTRKICLKNGVTVLFVTHSISEAVAMGDRILVFSSRPGEIVKVFDNTNKGKHDEKKRRQLVREITECLDITSPGTYNDEEDAEEY